MTYTNSSRGVAVTPTDSDTCDVCGVSPTVVDRDWFIVTYDETHVQDSRHHLECQACSNATQQRNEWRNERRFEAQTQ